MFRRRWLFSIDELNIETIDIVFRLITKYRGIERELQDYDLIPGFLFLQILSREIISENPRDREYLKRTLIEVFAKINRRLAIARIPEHFWVDRLGSRGALRYGLRVIPERIMWN